MQRALVAVVLVACGSRPLASPEVTAPSEAPAAADLSPPSSPITAGIYHRGGAIDAANLEVDPAHGTFRWAIDGCDFSGSGNGTMHVDGDAVVLEGIVAVWPSGTARLTPAPGGGFELVHDLGAHPEVQSWLPGGVCPTCGGSLGPSAPPVPCQTPFGES